MPYTTLVVLSDGTTYSGVNGCSLIVVDDETLERIENGEKVKDVPVVLEIGLQEYHPKP
jgi:hypothetical protein